MAPLARRDLLRASGLATAGALAGCPLPFSGGDAPSVQWAVTGATGARTFHPPAVTVPAARPSVVWQAPIQGRFGQAILATGSRAVAATPSGIWAIDLSDGSTAWTHSYRTAGGGASLALADGTIVVRRFFPNADLAPRRLGLSASDGTAAYARTGSHAGSALWVPTPSGLYGIRSAGTVGAFDAAGGEWGETLVETGGEIWGTVTDGERLFLPVNRDGRWTVEALSVPDGATAWTVSLPWSSSVSMLAAGDRLVFTDVPDVRGSPGARGLDPATGEIHWEFAWEDDALVPWRAVATEETVFLLARPGGQREDASYRLAAVDIASGEVGWRADTDLQFPYAVAEERLVGTTVTSQFPAPGLVAVDAADGSVDWRFEPGEGVGPGVAVSQGVLAFVATGDGPTLALLR